MGLLGYGPSFRRVNYKLIEVGEIKTVNEALRQERMEKEPEGGDRLGERNAI